MQIYDRNEIPLGYRQKSRVVYILLAIFLYQLGVHEFYRGSIGGGFGFLGAWIVSFIWLIGGLIVDDCIYIFPLVILLALFIAMIVQIVKFDRDNNGILMK